MRSGSAPGSVPVLAGAFLCAAGTRHPERQRSLRISLVTLEIKKDIHNKKQAEDGRASAVLRSVFC